MGVEPVPEMTEPRVSCLHTLVLDQADRTPERVAVRAHDGALTYGALASRARSLARRLRSLGVGAETPVGVFMPRSRDLPVALLGVLTAGGAYVPLDPGHPDERIAFHLQDTEAPLVVTTAALAGRIAGGAARAVVIDAEANAVAALRDESLTELSAPDRLAYIIYTSGSTGRPKGVMIEHRNAAALMAWAHREYSEAELARVVAATSITFDLSVFEIFAPLSRGGSIDVVEDGLAFAHWPERAEATLLNTVPSIVRELLALAALPPGLPVVNLAGEPLAKDVVEAIWRRCPGCRVYNLYGPSEDTTYSTGGVVLPGDPRPTIGRPLMGRRLHLLDEDGDPVPEGDCGEIHVGGPGVARGYWRRPDLTGGAFLPDPASPVGGVMYRTGDFGRLQPDGRVLFLGRRDDQIKLRGYRVDLGEIDAVLRTHPGVADVTTVVVEDRCGGPMLRCALALRPRTSVDEVDEWLGARLPAYMMPADWLPLKAIPKLPNGKVDRRSLRAHAPARRGSSESLPEGSVETRLAALWSELLGVTPICRDDVFLALGGHSLLAARLSARIRESFGFDVPGPQLLRRPTLRAQAELVGSAAPADSASIPAFSPAAGPARCSPVQLRFWTLEQLLPGSPRYNIPIAFQLAGPLDATALTIALRRLVERHGILRTVYDASAGAVRQRVMPPMDDVLMVMDVSDRAPEAARGEAIRLATSFVGRVFDLARQPPFAALLIDMGRDQRLLALSTHHIAADGSVDLVVDALSHAYAEALADPSAVAAPAAPSYIDFSNWQWAAVESAASTETALAYWVSRLADPPPSLDLPADRPAPAAATGRGDRHACTVPQATLDRLSRLSRSHGVSMFQVLLALTWAFLARLCDQEDLCVAAPLADRPHAAIRDTIGNFVNTVVLRGELGGDPSFETVLDQARTRTIEAIEHGSVPLDRIIDAVPASRRADGALFANVMLSLLQQAPRLAIPGVSDRAIELELPTTRFDLSFFFQLAEGGLDLSIEYDADRFEPSTVRRYAGHWMTLADAALADPSLPLSSLPLLSSTERTEILERWNATEGGYDARRPIHALFEDRARLDPDALAVTGVGPDLTYGVLNARADRLARAIVARTLGPGARIAILCDRSPHLIVAMLAVLKAGCAYVPLDPDSPPERQADMLRIAEAGAVIAETSMRAALEGLCAAAAEGLPCMLVDAADEDTTDLDGTPPVAVSADDLAYVIFTSGTTGAPKAVAVRHRPVVNLIEWVNATHAVGPRDRLLFVTSVAFDLSVYDVFGVLAAGASIRIVGRAAVKDPRALAEILECEPITFWDSAPIALDQCVAYLSGTGTALRLVFLSGDWIPVTLPGRLRARVPDVEIVALGGATEAVVWSNFHRVEAVEPDQSSIPYGRPIQNARYHILDRHMKPVPIGVPGDLFIGGEGLADGYFGDPALTAARFVVDPFRPHAGARLYRTGDRARYWEDGTIEFLGRRDTQVKIRGHRVETGEVEAAIAAQPGVRAAHVAIRGERSDRWLCGYVVLERADPGFAPTLRAALRARLPMYMIPAAIVVLDAFPLTPNGKLDHARLPEPGLAPPAGTACAKSMTAVETMIAEVWRNVLTTDRVSLDDNFFDAGGDSARLVEAHQAIESRLGRRMPIMALFRHTTIRALAEWLAVPPPAEPGAPANAEARLVAGRHRLAGQQRRRDPARRLTEAERR